MIEDLSEARKRLVIQTGKAVRKAVVERAEMLQEHLAKYDEAVRIKGPDDTFIEALVLLLVCSGAVDPVAREIGKFSELDKLLQATQEVPEDA